jgi:hypothetical protein
MLNSEDKNIMSLRPLKLNKSKTVLVKIKNKKP